MACNPPRLPAKDVVGVTSPWPTVVKAMEDA